MANHPRPPTVSVVIPCYNAWPLIRETLDSAKAQTLPPAEIIVADDHSTDGTWDKLQGIPGIKRVQTERNGGPGAARNAGVQAAVGAYVAFLDSDDLWNPDHLELLVGQLQLHPSAILAYSRVAYCGARQGVTPPSTRGYPTPENILIENLRGNITIHPSTIVMRRDEVNKLGGFRDIVEYVRGKRLPSEDIDFALRACAAGPVTSVPGPTARYRIHPHQLSQVDDLHLLVLARYKMRILKEWDRRQGPAAQRVAAVTAVRLWWWDILERLWTARNMELLPRFIRRGLRFPLLWGVTAPYVARAGVSALFPWIGNRFKAQSDNE